MDIGSIFLILALFIPVAIFIIRPILEQSYSAAGKPGQDISTLLAEREHIVATIKELDDDYNLGKVPADDYPPQRLALLQTGAEVLRKIDEITVKPSGLNGEDRLEAAISAHRINPEVAPTPARKNGNAVPPVPDDDLEQKIAARRRSMQRKAGGFCPKCGRPYQVTDLFCPHCGANLS